MHHWTASQVSEHTPDQLGMMMNQGRADIQLPNGAIMVPGRTNIVRCKSMSDGLAFAASIKKQRELESSK